MARVCTICAHPHRADIDAALVQRTGSIRSIAAQFGVALTSLRRHAEAHLPAQMVQAAEVQTVVDAGNLLHQVRDLRDRALGILTAAETGNDPRTALAAIREARACLELMGKVEGQLQERAETNVNVLVAPDWQRLRAVLLAALQPHPEARLAVALALEGAAG